MNRILWADDEIDLLKPHIMFLKAKGYDLVTVNNGRDALELAQSEHFDLIILDENMPGLTGLETLQQDLVNVFEEWIPTCRYEGMYLHPGRKALDFAESVGEDNFGCHNTDAHLRSSIIGRNVTIVMEDGELDLGEFGRIHFIDWDQTRARKRTVQVMLIGE